LEIDGSKARENTTMELSFHGAISFPGTEKLQLTLPLEIQSKTILCYACIMTCYNLLYMTVPTLNGLITQPTVSRPGHHNTQTHLEVLRQHHAILVRMLKSLTEFNILLLEVYTKEIIDQTTYEKFLMKQESSPHCSSAVLSGFLLLDIRKNLEEKAHLFQSFCECVEKVDHDCAEQLKG
jgi:hypothetical protein